MISIKKILKDGWAKTLYHVFKQMDVLYDNVNSRVAFVEQQTNGTSQANYKNYNDIVDLQNRVKELETAITSVANPQPELDDGTITVKRNWYYGYGNSNIKTWFDGSATVTLTADTRVDNIRYITWSRNSKDDVLTLELQRYSHYMLYDANYYGNIIVILRVNDYGNNYAGQNQIDLIAKEFSSGSTTHSDIRDHIYENIPNTIEEGIYEINILFLDEIFVNFTKYGESWGYKQMNRGA